MNGNCLVLTRAESIFLAAGEVTVFVGDGDLAAAALAVRAASVDVVVSFGLLANGRAEAKGADAGFESVVGFGLAASVLVTVLERGTFQLVLHQIKSHVVEQTYLADNGTRADVVVVVDFVVVVAGAFAVTVLDVAVRNADVFVV